MNRGLYEEEPKYGLSKAGELKADLYELEAELRWGLKTGIFPMCLLH